MSNRVQEYSVESVPDPTPGPGEVVVAVAAVGICGTDIHIVDGEFAPTPYPIIPGHEFTGEVVALGSGVSGIREGDRVAVGPSLFCGACHFCAIGRGPVCANRGWVILRVTDGLNPGAPLPLAAGLPQSVTEAPPVLLVRAPSARISSGVALRY